MVAAVLVMTALFAFSSALVVSCILLSSLSSDRTLASSYEELVGRGHGGGTQLRRYLDLGRYNIRTLSVILFGVAT
jgi:hypothetical protein